MENIAEETGGFYERTYLFSQERGVINRIDDALSTQDQQELYQRAEQKMVSAAKESELVHQAEENTRAMLIGMLPMAFGWGEGGEQNAPLARAVIGGLSVATVSTLFFVPLMFTLVRRNYRHTAAVVAE